MCRFTFMSDMHCETRVQTERMGVPCYLLDNVKWLILLTKNTN